MDSLRLVDSVLVEVRVVNDKDPYEFDEERKLLLPTEDPSKLGFNFGKVLKTPSYVIDDKFAELAADIVVGATVFFSASRSYNYLPQKDDSVKLLMIPVSSVDAVVIPQPA